MKNLPFQPYLCYPRDMLEKSHDNHLYLVDGSGFIFRAFHALPPLTRPDGTPINAVLGFTNMLIKLILDMKADHLAVIFDSGRRSFRNDIYPDYKAHRPDAPEELIPQFSLIRDACEAFNVPMYELEGYEADDLIATFAEQAKARNMEVTIVSSDKDLMQLVDPQVQMYDPIRNRPIGANEVIEKFGVPPEKVIEIQALAGDATDNVPGVPGIGIKTAAELIIEYGDLETLLSRIEEIKQPKRRERLSEHAEDALISKQLVTLKRDIETSKSLDDFVFREPDPKTLVQFLDAQNFTTVKNRLEKRGFKLNGSNDDLQKPQQKGTYTVVQTTSELKAWIDRIHQAGMVVIDTETTSLDPMQAELVGLSLSIHEGEACYIPLAHKAPKTDLFQQNKPDQKYTQIPLQEALEVLAPILKDPSVLKIGQNLKYDMKVLGRYNIELTPFDDTMVLSYVLDGTSHGHGMDELAKLHFDYDTIKYKDVAGTGKSQLRFDDIDIAIAAPYAAEDADITLRLYTLLKQRLIDESCVTVYETMDRPLIKVLYDMETAGIGINVTKLKDLSKDFAIRIQNLEQEIYAAAGHEFNVGSPKQLGEVLFEELGFEGGKKTKTGNYGTSVDIMEDLAVQGHHLPVLILDWRHLSKLKSTYADSLLTQINPDTGRIHTNFGMTVTSTGRLSSNDPNLQNIPVRSPEGLKIRGAFEAKPDHKLLSLDYSQIELRLLAHMADIDPLQKAFKEGKDIHAATASEVFNIPLDQIDSELRNRAKVINFGIIYGMSAQGLSRQLRISRTEAAQHIKDYLARYPGIENYMEDQKKAARESGYVRTLFDRKCFIPGIQERNPARRAFAERAAINAPLQGSVSDIIKRAMVKIPSALVAKGLEAKMLLQIHDELIFEVPDHQLDQTIEVVKPIMEKAAYLKVPMIVDSGFGQTWADT